MNIKDDFVVKNINEGYLVGGMVRDYFITEISGNPVYTPDRDIAIKGAEQFAKKLAEQLDAVFITLDENNKIYRLILKDKKNYLDISELRGESIEEDLRQRDFTINSIAYDLKEEKFIDITGGIEDIKNKKLRAISEKNFIDDPLRLLRAFRFMATTGFVGNGELEQIISKHKMLILEPAKERVHDEIMKLFGGMYASQTLLKMLETGLLELLFPCVNEMKQIPSNSHHHLDLIHHAIETVRQIEIMYGNIPNSYIISPNDRADAVAHMNQIDFGGYPRINHLKIAGFLHDIGKYSTWTIEEDGKTIWTVTGDLDYPKDKVYRHRFIKHDLEGEKLVKSLLKSLKFSNKQIEYISKMVRYHIYPANVISSPNFNNKVMMRYVRKMGENVIDNILLARADRLSAQGPSITKEMTDSNINGLDTLLNFYLDIRQNLKPLPKLLDGNEIMQLLQIKQSPKLGEIIRELHEAQLNSEVNTREEALIFIKNFKIS